jgi:hypothetical protein
MSDIDIPFSREMAIAAIDGWKVATTRSERKGVVGGTFFVEDPRRIGEGGPATKYGAQFRIIAIMEVDLKTVKNLYYRLEGFNSREEFEKTWRSLHRGHFTTGKLYYMHIFGRVV